MILRNARCNDEYTYYVFHVQLEDGHCQAPKHVFVLYVVIQYITLSPNKVVLEKYILSNLVTED